MNYKKIYEDIILKAKSEDRQKGLGIYYESHHIIPRCLKGSDKKENLVLLTAREHYVAHKLLIEIYPGIRGLFYAIWCLSLMKKDSINFRISSREYERLKIERSKIPTSQDTRDKIAKGNTGKVRSEEVKDNLRQMYTGVSLSEETKQRMSVGSSGDKNGMFDKHHSQESIDKIIKKCKENKPTDEQRDKMKKAWDKIENITCPWCGLESRGPNMIRYHFENCKQNPNYIPKEVVIVDYICPHCGVIGHNKGNMYKNHFERCKLKSVLNENG